MSELFLSQVLRVFISIFIIMMISPGCQKIKETVTEQTEQGQQEQNNSPQNLRPLPSNTRSPIGSNLGAFGAGTPEWVFIDAFLKASPWIPNFCGNFSSLSEDDQRWVQALASGQCASSYIYHEMNGHYPSGTYALYWEGQGAFRLEGDAEFNHKLGDTSHAYEGMNRAAIEVTPSDSGIYLEINQLVSNNYLRNFRLIMPGGVCGKNKNELEFDRYCKTSRGGSGTCKEGTSCFDFEQIYWDRYKDKPETINKPKAIFHPAFVQRLKPYRGIRYMKWMSTHDSLLRDWSQRATLDKAFYADDSEYNDSKSQGSRGIPYEASIALSNLLNADLYLTIPAQTSNDFNLNLARLVKDQLKPSLKVYLEYSNEVWNFDYGVDRAYMLTMAENRGIEGSDTQFVPNGIKLARAYSERAVEIFELWDIVFGSNSEQLVKILAGFVDQAYTNEILDWNNAYEKVDALAATAYFTGELGFASNEDQIASWARDNNLDAFFNELNQGGLGSQGGLDEINDHYTNSSQIAKEHGLKLLAYEGGFGIEAFKFSTDYIELVTAFNKNAQLDKRMGQATIKNFKNWREAGGQEFFHFNNSDAQMTYGSLEYQMQDIDKAPKYKDIVNYIETTNCWWDQCEKE